jgi:glycine/D-amino acid oxidase-like deaminating enzyme
MPLSILEHCKLTPYWWDDVPRPAFEEGRLPASVDVAVIGAGYTGLHAALQTARGGRSTLVLDAEDAGWGCSTRNGGQVSTSIKPGFDQLASRHGNERAFEILREGQRSLAWVGEFIHGEKIACDYRVAGRFHAAHNQAQYDAMAARLAHQPKGLEIEAHMVSRIEQRSELGSDAYWGGAVYTQHCSVHPARYHQGLLKCALAAGVQVMPRNPVTGIEKQGGHFLLTTPRGTVLSRDVVVATNGYTGRVTPWLQRRVIPIGSYMIATEPLPKELMGRLMPRDRIVSDTRKVVYYYRASPDRSRILFGGRVSHKETDCLVSGALLHASPHATVWRRPSPP